MSYNRWTYPQASTPQKMALFACFANGCSSLGAPVSALSRTATAVRPRVFWFALRGPCMRRKVHNCTCPNEWGRENVAPYHHLPIPLSRPWVPLPHILPSLAGSMRGRRFSPRGAAHDGRTRSGPAGSAAAGPARSGSAGYLSSAQRPAAAGLARSGPRLPATVRRAPSADRCRSGVWPGPPVRRAPARAAGLARGRCSPAYIWKASLLWLWKEPRTGRQCEAN
jgi:hypothetical protein